MKCNGLMNRRSRKILLKELKCNDSTPEKYIRILSETSAVQWKVD